MGCFVPVKTTSKDLMGVCPVDVEGMVFIDAAG